MTDEWSGLADMLANLIEKYASDLDIENLPDITVDNHVEEKIRQQKTGKMFFANSKCIMYNKHDKCVQTKFGKIYLLIFE